MAEKAPKRSFWLNVETIIIVIFFLFFIVWAMRKCNNEVQLRQAGNDKYRQQQIKDSLARVQGVAPAPISTLAPATVTPTTPSAAPTPAPTPIPQPVQPLATSPAAANSTQQLWVVIDGLNVREKPELKAKSFGKLSLHDRVTFLGDVTKNTQKLSLGAEEADEPWVKIKTKRGTVGWVYGAGVSFYKTKRKGAF